VASVGASRVGGLGAGRRALGLVRRVRHQFGGAVVPTCDLDHSPENRVVGLRTFGADPKTVAALAAEWVDAFQAESVLACAKHVPEVGRVITDPSLASARIDATAEQLKESDLAPFRTAIDAGVASMMVSHANYAALDPTRMPVPVSREVLQWYLRQQLKYDNLILVEQLGAAGLRAAGLSPEATSEPEIGVLALRAGCDLLIASDDTVADDSDRDGARGTAELRVRALLGALRHGGGDARFVEQPTRAGGGPLIVAVFGDIGDGEDRLAPDPHTINRVIALRDQARVLDRDVISLHLPTLDWLRD
jgi:hypothetical protein